MAKTGLFHAKNEVYNEVTKCAADKMSIPTPMYVENTDMEYV